MTRTPDADRARRDPDGHCSRCGLKWPDERETLEPHECPPGFQRPISTTVADLVAAPPAAPEPTPSKEPK